MPKKFNDTGLCIPDRHYMVDISNKIHQIIQLTGDGEYFTINRPRQFGKTTTLSLLAKHLNRRVKCWRMLFDNSRFFSVPLMLTGRPEFLLSFKALPKFDQEIFGFLFGMQNFVKP